MDRHPVWLPVYSDLIQMYLFWTVIWGHKSLDADVQTPWQGLCVWENELDWFIGVHWDLEYQ